MSCRVDWRTIVMALGCILAAMPRPVHAHGAPRDGSVRRLGSLELHACGMQGGYCGRLDRPLDPAEVLPDRISIYFEFYPHLGRLPAKGTLVATEGGPGYSTTGSREDYLALFRPLMIDHDVLLMDNRGTGQSGAIDCGALQTGEQWSIESVAECGRSLGERAPLYSTAYAADDLAAILDALELRGIDLYGDSYGTYFGQVFAIRHPAALRTLVLDGAYPLTGNDYAWYPSYAPAMRDKFNLACARSPACAAIPGGSIEHIHPALESLRAVPFKGQAHDVDGRLRVVDANAAGLAIVMYGGAPPLSTLRETDAAARAFITGDTVPLLRLMAETAAAVDSRDPSGDPARWSAGLAAAVMCHDPPQIFDMRLEPAERATDRDRALAERRHAFPETYAPFTIDEYRAMPLDYSFLDACVAWPVAPPGRPDGQLGSDASYPDIPVLVISGELDNITTPADGAAVAANFKRAVQVRIANSFHVNALPRARSPCAAQIVLRFIATTLPGDIACAARVPAVHLVPRFVAQAHDLDAATALHGNQADDAELKFVTAALFTVVDLVTRVPGNASGHGVGLRGGTFLTSEGPHGQTITLDAVKWSDDLAVSGTVSRSVISRAARSRDAKSRGTSRDGGRAEWRLSELDLSMPDRASGHLSMRWREDVADAHADITGSIGGHEIVARAPVP